MCEKWLVIEIGGYRRGIPESKLGKVRREIEEIKQELLQKGASLKSVEECYSLKIVEDA